MVDFLLTAAGVAADTVTYLVAWWGLPVWALAGTVVLQRVARAWPLEGWAQAESAPRRLSGAFLLAVARPFGRTDVRLTLRQLGHRPGATAVYLAAGHGLTLYYFLLLGPLLGKDVLLSHAVGMSAFAGLAAGLMELLGPGGEVAPVGGTGPGPSGSGDAPGGDPPGAAGADDGRWRWRSLALGEGGRFLGWSLWGLAVGGLVGAAGLAAPGLHLVDLLPGTGLARQAVHAVAGVLAAVVTFVWPVAALFVGTFLWKAGLAHAGLVAFFCAATLAPQRLRLYREVWGAGRTVRWTAALALAALAAGLLVAVLFGLGGLEIRYKLVPGQLWRP